MKTNVADTSLKAYWEQENMGALDRQTKNILDFLAAHPDRDYTRRELSEAADILLSSVCGRVNKLLDPTKSQGRAWIDELPTRKCSEGKFGHPVRIHRPAGEQLTLFEKAA